MREENDCFVENAISVYAAAGIHGKRRMNRAVCVSGEQESPNVRQRHSGVFLLKGGLKKDRSVISISAKQKEEPF